ncbi:hypothetical protein GE061_000206 [Apolygus lucorum]|uniref:PiggyBac transposable element-derived protein domain-containing protein n=1 Tax=Apolygus lucorum TaxID=248454 RepID=A0A8S9Y5L6_APOLU|nr:hypothetical protein GE061_000206 [Apolygus lucorum]
MASRSSTNNFKSRGAYILSLDPRPNKPSDEEESEEEAVDDVELERRINELYETLPDVESLEDDLVFDVSPFEDVLFHPELMYYHRKEYGILSLGTLRENRSAGAASILKSEKKLKKEGRGAHDEVSDSIRNVSVTRWIDNKSVLLSSTYTSSEPVGVCKRWLSAQKLKEYNLFMGGVDKSDHLIALYKTPHRTFKWYMALFGQLLDMVLNNAWILYKEDNPSSKMRLKKFRLDVASSLHLWNRKNKTSKTTTPPIKANVSTDEGREMEFKEDKGKRSYEVAIEYD